MAFSPVALIAPQYDNYPEYYLKFYEASTTTPLAMATDSTGATTLAKARISAQGFIVTDGNAIFTPHVNASYDAYLFPTSSSADANETQNAVRIAQNASSSSLSGPNKIYFDNVSAMKVDPTPSIGDTVFCHRYYANGKLVEGLHFLVVAGNTGTDDGGSFHDLSNGNQAQLIGGKVTSEHFGCTSTGDNLSKLQAYYSYCKSEGLDFILAGFTHDISDTLLIDASNTRMVFLPNAKLNITTDNVALQINPASQIENVDIIRPHIVSAGFGQASAGLIQVNNVKNWTIYKPRIDSNNAQARSRGTTYNGIATAVNCEAGEIIGGLITGTPKSGIHISTASRDITCWDVEVRDAGNDDTGANGFTPSFDTGGYGNNHFIRCKSYNPQGEHFLIASENNATYGDQLCTNNSVINCYGLNSGRSQIRTTTFTPGVVPNNILVKDCYFDTAGLQGLEVGAGSVRSINNVYKDVQNSAISATSDSEDVSVYSEKDRLENWTLADNINFNGVNVGTSNFAEFNNTEFVHDLVGVTGTNVFCFGLLSGKTTTEINITNPKLTGDISQAFRMLNVPTKAHFKYTYTGAPPAGDQAKNGSQYNRLDGSGSADNLYIKRGGSWVGIA